MKKIITGKVVWRQLVADLIGKDSYRGVTLTYSWLANQFGHLSLGFMPTLVVYTCLKKHSPIPYAAFWAAIYVAIGWLLFELYNFLGPLLLNRQSKYKLFFLPKSTYVFNPDWSNIAFDTFTDVCVFCLGAFLASLFLNPVWSVGGILISLTLILMYPFSYWFTTKIFLQEAQYPFQFRLSQWDAVINEPDKEAVLKFVADKNQGHHLFVFGGRKSGKTTISVAIATERSIKHQTCIYTTGMKLYNLFSEPDLKLLTVDKNLWTWRTASLLVIDDINPGDPIRNDLITPALFLSMMDADRGLSEENRAVLRTKNVIWVMGKEKNNESFYANWKEMLQQNIGVPAEKIYAINLQFTKIYQ